MRNYELKFECELALGRVDLVQDFLKSVKKKINLMKAELGKAGFEVMFSRGTSTFDELDELHLHHPMCGSINIKPFFKESGTTFCKITKKNSDEVIVKTKAEVAEGDINIKLLGEYLSLARATKIVFSGYNV